GGMAGMTGRGVEAHMGRHLSDILGPLGDESAAIHREVVASGEPQLDREASGTTPAAPGEERHWMSSFTPVRGLDGETVIGVGVTVIDITERLALLQAERDARIRADFLARAGAILDSSLDFEETLANVANIAIPEIADWRVVSILDESGGMREVATAHVDPAQREVARELSERYPPDPEAPTGTLAVARRGETAFVREITDEMLVAGL